MEGNQSDGQVNISGKEDPEDGAPAIAAVGQSELSEERAKLTEEFNLQRAKMKELFLQKEEELRSLSDEKAELQSELLVLREQVQEMQAMHENQKCELMSLHQLICETVEESSSGSEEARRLQARNAELEQQLSALARQQQQEEPSTSPPMLPLPGQRLQEAARAPALLVRSLARRLGADDAPPETRKAAEEQALRALVAPLEEEVRALRDRLRDADAQLRHADAQLHAAAAAAASPADSDQTKDADKSDSKDVKVSASPAEGARCDMCDNYEKQLVLEQTRAGEARAAARAAQQALKLAIEELESSRAIHDETVRAWHAERAAAAAALAAAAADHARAGVRDATARADAAAAAALQRVTALTVDRETLQNELDTLQRENAQLRGEFVRTALQLQEEAIALPDTVEELQERWLLEREALVGAVLARDAARGEAAAARGEVAAARAEAAAAAQRLADLVAEHNATKQQLATLSAEREELSELGARLRQAGDRIEELLNDKARLQADEQQLRARVSALQQDLDNTERVQLDFVRLSQSLQVQLERIREAETAVRWQLEDDVSACGACRAPLATNKTKVHCRHCGRIFCGSCTAPLPAGPRRVPVPVCAVCRTLLQPHAPPYFSTQPPAHA